MVASAVALGLAGGVPSTPAIAAGNRRRIRRTLAAMPSADEGPAMTPVGAAIALAGAAPQPGRHVA